LTHCYGLFVVAKKLNSFAIKQFQTLCAKHPGWVTSATPQRTLRLGVIFPFSWSDQDAASSVAPGGVAEFRDSVNAVCAPHVSRRGRERIQRFSTGITNFSAVCVGEKPTTFISFSPHLRPAARTSFSVICFWPLGYTIHNAAAPFRLLASLATCGRSLEVSADKKIHSASGAGFPLLVPVMLRFFVTGRSSPRKSESKSPIKETAAFGLMPNFSSRVLG